MSETFDDFEARLQAAKEADAREIANWHYRQRVENAAVRIFAAMQANPNWSGSQTAQRDAVSMAHDLIAAIDADFKRYAPEGKGVANDQR